MELAALFSVIAYSTTLLSVLLVASRKITMIRIFLVVGYTIMAALYALNIQYHAAIGYAGWAVLNTVLFYELYKADKEPANQ